MDIHKTAFTPRSAEIGTPLSPKDKTYWIMIQIEKMK